MRAVISEFIDKKPGFSDLDLIDQVKYMSYFFVKTTKDPIFNAKNIEECFDLADIIKPKNVSDMLAKICKKGLFVPKEKGFSFQRDEFNKLEQEFSQNKPQIKILKNLEMLLVKISDANQRKFLGEAISCYKIEAFRAAIIMTWCLTMDNMQNYVMNKKLREFNLSMQKQYPKLKQVARKEDFSEIEESKFIEICRIADIITKDVRKILDEKLGVRNSAAHPNSIVFSESKVTSYIEDLLDNVISKLPS
jgi:hypothetical protein